MRTIIAGGRDFADYPRLRDECRQHAITEVVSGGARGADHWGEVYAEEIGVPVKRFSANWEKHGKKAGPIRNSEMADYAQALIAFWDGRSKGTKHMIAQARKRLLRVTVVWYGTEPSK